VDFFVAPAQVCLWPITTCCAAVTDGRFRGEPEVAPAVEAAASVGNDPKRSLAI
jgi:hypothetical protein